MECGCQGRSCLCDRVSQNIEEMVAVPQTEQEFEIVHRILQKGDCSNISGRDGKNYSEKANRIYADETIPRKTIDSFLEKMELFPNTVPVQDHSIVDCARYNERMSYFEKKQHAVTRFVIGGTLQMIVGGGLAIIGGEYFKGSATEVNAVLLSAISLAFTSLFPISIGLRKETKLCAEQEADSVLTTHKTVLENARITDAYVDVYHALGKASELYQKITKGEEKNG